MLNPLSLPIGVLATTLIMLAFATFAIVRFSFYLTRRHWDNALTMLGLHVAFIAMVITVLMASAWVADSEQATHRHNCIMYELALQRNANPDLPNVAINPAWHELECYPAP